MFVNLEEITEPTDPRDSARVLDDEQRLVLLNQLIGELKPLDRQIMLLYLDDLDTAQISEVTGLSVNHVGVKIHWAKPLLAQLYEGIAMTDIDDAAMKAAWRSHSTEVPKMSVSYVRHRTSQLHRSFRIRNILEQGTCVLGPV